MKQKSLKALKKEIQEETAIDVGYFQGIVPAILELEPLYLLDVMKNSGDLLQHFAKENKEAEFLNCFVTEAVRAMKYSDFKAVAKYFFSYRQTEVEILAEPIQITRKLYEKLQADSEKIFATEHVNSDLKQTIQDLTYFFQPNGDEVLGYNPLNQVLAVLFEQPIYSEEPSLMPNLISDYRSGASELELVQSRLLELDNLQFRTKFLELFSDFREPLILDEDLVGEVNVLLSEANMELVVHDVSGYSPGDEWRLSYLWDKESGEDFQTKAALLDYLEHEVGAYYRGSLTDLVIYDKEQNVIDSHPVDRELFWEEGLEALKALTGEGNYVSIEVALELEQLDVSLSESELKAFVSLSPEAQQAQLSHLQESRTHRAKL
jgi:hypothetical protein